MMDMGLIGLATMGQNLALNIEDKGYSVAVYNRTEARTGELIRKKATGKRIKGAYSLQELANLCRKPRKVIIMVQAGKPVDDVIGELLPSLDPGDILLDCGNSHFFDTARRRGELARRGILFMGVGISGGEEGALRGPSIMPGGEKGAYDQMEEIFLKIAAYADGEPCCTYVGPEGSGHFVKIVHNGIEYADMEIIAESVHLMRAGLGMSYEEIRERFESWKEDELGSYLMDITTDILGVRDPETGKPVLDVILDKAQQKGTGKWTTEAALDLGIPLSIIDSAVYTRNISALKSERVTASRILKGATPAGAIRGKKELVAAIQDALLCSKISSYAQGFSLMRAASRERRYDLRLDEIARIWKGGCIIRARILDPIIQAFRRNPDLCNLYLDDFFVGKMEEKHHNWRKVIIEAVKRGVACPVLAASLQYYDGYRSAVSPANVIQAQRDYFGAHTYERVDKAGVFHLNWQELRNKV